MVSRLEGLLGEARARKLALIHRDDRHSLGPGAHLEGDEEPLQGGVLGVHAEHVEPG